MSIAGKLGRLEGAARGDGPREVEHIAADIGDGYAVDVDAPAGTLAKIVAAYGDEDEP